MMFRYRVRTIVCASCVVLLSSVGAAAQKSVAVSKAATVPSSTAKLPAVKQIDAAGLLLMLKTNGKPLLINFWATWCDPCREEFPDLVKINTEYGGKIDFITVSLDDLTEINRDVPKFLIEMKADMPAYLLKTLDESEAIFSVSKEWKGGLPFTILFNAKGEEVYARQGKVKLEVLRTELGKLLSSVSSK